MGLVMEGISQVKVTCMGEGLVLLNLENRGDIGRIKHNHLQWWNSMFKKVNIWSLERVAFRRTVWLNVFGIPLHA